MSVFSYPKASAVFAPAVFVVAVVSLSVAHAEDIIGVGGCVGAPGSFNCVVRVGPAGDPYVRTVPQPLTDEDKARTEARDHKWIDRCHPTIAQDRYGVPRYHYAAWGCEFGVIE